MFKSYSMDLAGRKLTVEVGRVAAQANGAVFMHYGDTVVPVSYTHLLLELLWIDNHTTKHVEEQVTELQLKVELA